MCIHTVRKAKYLLKHNLIQLNSTSAKIFLFIISKTKTHSPVKSMSWFVETIAKKYNKTVDCIYKIFKTLTNQNLIFRETNYKSKGHKGKVTIINTDHIDELILNNIIEEEPQYQPENDLALRKINQEEPEEKAQKSEQDQQDEIDFNNVNLYELLTRGDISVDEYYKKLAEFKEKKSQQTTETIIDVSANQFKSKSKISKKTDDLIQVSDESLVVSDEMFYFFEQYQLKKKTSLYINKKLQKQINIFDQKLHKFMDNLKLTPDLIKESFNKLIKADNNFYLNNFLKFNNVYFDNFNQILTLKCTQIDWDDTSWVDL